MRPGDRVTRTSGGRGGGNYWEMKSGPLCAWVRLSGNYNRPRNTCSTWRLDSNDVAPRAVMAQAAAKHGVLPRSISFKGAMQTLEAFQPRIEDQATQDR